LVRFARAVVRAGRGGTDPTRAAADAAVARRQRRRRAAADAEEDEEEEEEAAESDEPEEVADARRDAETRAAAVQRLLSNRLQTAALFAAPFSMRFAAGGAACVRDLLRCELPEWGLRGGADGDAANPSARVADPRLASAELPVARPEGGLGEFRFQIEAMLRAMAGSDQARAGGFGHGLFACDGAAAAAANAAAAKAEALADAGAAGSSSSSSSSFSFSRRGGVVAGYGRADPLAKHANPFLTRADAALVARGNANGFKGAATPTSEAGTAPDAQPAGPLPQKKLPFDPRFQRGPWDPAGKQPRARQLAPRLHPPSGLKVTRFEG
jgi:hypothetical protein